MKKIDLNIYFFFVLFFLFTISFSLKLLFSDNLSLWLDEAYTVWFTKRTWSELWFWVPQFESHPPFYYTLMKIWGNIFGGLNGINYRYASIFLSSGLFFLSFILLRKLNKNLSLERRNSYLTSSLLFLFSPIIFWYSVEARPYILFTLSYLLSVYSASQIIINPQINKYWFLFSVGTLLTNWSHNIGPLFSAVLFSVVFLQVFSSKDRKAYLTKTFFSTVFVSILSIPLIFFVFNQLSQWSVATWIPEPTISSFGSTIQEFLFPDYLHVYLTNHIGNFFAELASKLLIVSLLVLLLFGLGNLYKKNKALFLLFVSSITVVPLITFVVAYYGPNIFLKRTLIPILAPYFILLSISTGFIKNKKLSLIIIFAIGINLTAGIYGKLQWGYKEPWEKITNTLIINKRENDVILLLPNSIRIPIDIYDTKDLLYGEIFSLPHEYPAIDASSFYPAGTPSVPGLTQSDVFRIDSLVEGKDRVLFLTRNEKLFDPEKVAMKFLTSRYSLEMEKKWGGITLYTFVIPSKEGLNNR